MDLLLGRGLGGLGGLEGLGGGRGFGGWLIGTLGALRMVGDALWELL